MRRTTTLRAEAGRGACTAIVACWLKWLVPISEPGPLQWPLQLGDLEIALGDAVALSPEDDDDEEADGAAPLALVQAMWQAADGEAQAAPASAYTCCPVTLGPVHPAGPVFKGRLSRGQAKPP